MIYQIMERDENGRIVTIGTTEMYNLDGIMSAAKWVREPIKGIKTFDAPQMTSAISIKSDGRGRTCIDSIGYMHNNSNTVQYNQQLVGLYGSPCAAANGLPITSSNFDRVVALFASRKLIESNWIIQQNQYMVPDTTNPDYQQFVNDAVVFSLFESKSQQSSLRNITYTGK